MGHLPRRRAAGLAAALVACLLAGCGARPLTPPARADAALRALDGHFYQNGRWQGAGYWQNAEAFGAVLDGYQRTRDPALGAMIPQVYAANRQHGRAGDFTSNAIDDEGWWGLDWVRAWDLTGDPAYLDTARQIFAHMAGTWDDTCGGGVWWTADKRYKNAITNELFLLLAVELHERTAGDRGPRSYLAWARREADWFLGSGMINAAGLVNDGLDVRVAPGGLRGPAAQVAGGATGCANNGATTWTYNQGVILAGLAELSRDTGDRRYLRAAERIADAVLASHLLVDQNGVLREPCEGIPGSPSPGSCGADGEEFKGIFVRYLWWLYGIDRRAPYRAFLARTLEALWTKDRTPLGDFGVKWDGPAPEGLLGVDVETDTAAAAALGSTAVPGPEPPRVGPHALPPPLPA